MKAHRRVAPQSPRARTAAPTLSLVRKALLQVMPTLEAKDLAPDASLVEDLGVDSLKVAELSVVLEQLTGRPIFLAEVFAEITDPRHLTVGQLAELLERG